MKRIIVMSKETNAEVMRFDYHLDWLEPEVAAYYALTAAKFSMGEDASDIMSFMMWMRADALDGSIFKVEADNIIEMKKIFGIAVNDIESNIKNSTQVTDLFS